MHRAITSKPRNKSVEIYLKARIRAAVKWDRIFQWDQWAPFSTDSSMGCPQNAPPIRFLRQALLCYIGSCYSFYQLYHRIYILRGNMTYDNTLDSILLINYGGIYVWGRYDSEFYLPTKCLMKIPKKVVPISMGLCRVSFRRRIGFEENKIVDVILVVQHVVFCQLRCSVICFCFFFPNQREHSIFCIFLM